MDKKRPAGFFRLKNKYEMASIIGSMIIALFPIIGHLIFHLFPQGIFSALVFTIPLAVVPGVLAWLARSIRSGILAVCSAIFPIILFWLHYFIVTVLYFISFGKIILV